jgi:multidrug transporter EmrE-like cation transporter
MKYVVFLILAVLINTGANVFFKYSSLNSEQRALSLILLAVGLLLGAGNVILFTKSLKGIGLNIAYPVYSAGTILLVTLAAFLVFREHLTALRVAGIAVIMAGMVLVSV